MAVRIDTGFTFGIRETESLESGLAESVAAITFGAKGLSKATDVRTEDGTSDGQQDLVWWDRRSLTGNETLDLAGALTSRLDGSVVTFAEVTAIAIYNESTSITLEVGATTANQFSIWLNVNDGNLIQPECLLANICFGTGYAVTAGTGDNLLITATSGTVIYNIAIAGRSV